MTTAAFDPSVLLAALVRDHPEHQPARAIIEFLATGLADVAMVCTAPAAVASALVRAGAEPGWARERARDVVAMVRLLGVDEEDVLQGLAHGEAGDLETVCAAAALRRHGVALVVAAADRRRGYEDCGIATVLSIGEADEQVEVLIPAGG